MLTRRPAPDEYAPFYAGYIGHVADGACLERLQAQPSELRALLAGYDDERARLPLAAGKWSLLDLLGHISDAERVFAFRLLWFARADPSALPGFDQDAWAREAAGAHRTVAEALDEFDAVRQASLTLVRSLPDASADRSGIANGKAITVRALAWIIAGHAQHHLDALHEYDRG